MAGIEVILERGRFSGTTGVCAEKLRYLSFNAPLSKLTIELRCDENLVPDFVAVNIDGREFAAVVSEKEGCFVIERINSNSAGGSVQELYNILNAAIISAGQ